MASSSTSVLYADLEKSWQNEDYNKALKISNKLFQFDQTDEVAYQCKVVCLVKLSKIEECLKIMKNKNKSFDEMIFEKAYCLYRVNRTEESLEVLNTATDMKDPRIIELKAQVMYRLESYEHCLQAYRTLLKITSDDYEDERSTNMSAVIASLKVFDKADTEIIEFGEATYELCYNEACSLVAENKLDAAEKKLIIAYDLCKLLFEDEADVTEQEIENEMSNIRLLHAYIKQLRGDTDGSIQIYNLILKNKPTDVAVAAVASNNMITLNKEHNVFDSRKKVKIATGVKIQHKLHSSQRRSIDFNQCLLHYYTNHVDDCLKLAKTIEEQVPDQLEPVMMQVSMYVKTRQFNRGIELLQKLLKQDVKCNHADHYRMVLAHLHLLKDDTQNAFNTLSGLSDELKFTPGVFSALLTFGRENANEQTVEKLYRDAINHYTLHGNHENLSVVQLMSSLIKFYHENSMFKQSVDILERLHNDSPNDKLILAKLITSYSKFDVPKAKLFSKKLPEVTGLTSDLDLDQLENTNNMAYMRRLRSTFKNSPQTPSSPCAGDVLIHEKKKKKRKRKVILPKNYVKSDTPDPERWLKKQERSYYRGKRRDKRKEMGRGTQGSTGEQSLKSISSPKVEETVQGPRTQKPSAKQKKKRKGNKW